MGEKVPPIKKSEPVAKDTDAGASKQPPSFQLKSEQEQVASPQGPQVAQKKEKPAKDKPAPQKVKQEYGYKSYTSDNSIVTIPDGAQGDLPILTIVGGKTFATKEWMKTQVPANFFSTHIISLSNYWTGYTKQVKPDIAAATADAKVTGTPKALIGFSAGGYRVEAAKGDESWAVIGMIDAVVFNKQSYPAPVYQVYNFWGNNTEKDDARHLLHVRIANTKEVAGESHRNKEVGHPGMPAAWFKLYGDRL
jgi:hypothetical protein